MFQEVNYELVKINTQSSTQLYLDHIEECSAERLCSDHLIVLNDSLRTSLAVSLHSSNTQTPLIDCLATLNAASEAQSPHKFSVYVYPHLYFTKYKCENGPHSNRQVRKFHYRFIIKILQSLNRALTYMLRVVKVCSTRIYVGLEPLRSSNEVDFRQKGKVLLNLFTFNLFLRT